MMGGFVSMFLIKSLVILSSSSTSLILRGAPPLWVGSGPGGEGVEAGVVFIGWLMGEGGDPIVLG